CNTDFLTNDQQRTHFMSDWHKYNRKRRIASLDALSLESFATLAAASEQEQVETAAPDHHCIPCNKRYNSQNAYNNHIASKKHQATAKSYIPDFSSTIRAPKADDPHLDWKSRFDAIESDEALHALIREKISQATPLPANACLFCLHTSATLDASLHHMRHAHSFAPPRMERLADAPGMMAYLADKVALANLCLFCDAGLWHSLEAVQEHMRVKGHCKLAWEREEDRDELAEFYDW
ncbi:C2H2 type zinc-finger-domain-containing protein, partial [Chytriomyces sp. MP71]